MNGIPSGTVTFVFSDLEGSTESWEKYPDAMNVALERHDTIVRAAIAEHGGYVFSTAGDAFAAAFGRAADAIAAAKVTQAGLAVECWPEPVELRVRMGIHTGEAQERDDDYFGPALNRAARIMGAAHGGQVLVSASTAELLDGELLVDLGEHRLKDLSQPMRLFQLGDDPFPAIATLSVGAGTLPVQRTELLGRDDDVATVVDLVSTHRLVTLIGFGGIGKTRLALAAAAEVADHHQRGVHFVDLAPITDGTLVGPAVLESAGILATRLDTDGPMYEQAASALAGQDMLLVLDNCEHVLDDVVDFVDRLLELSEAPTVLATSREALEIDGERRFRVKPLDVADAATPSPAVELFVQRATAVGHHVDENDPAVGAICRQLDGVPLAIELAAARTSLMSVNELATRLEEGLDMLGSRRRRGRHRSLEAVLEWSWNLLDDDVADLLIQLATFSGGWTLEAAEAICHDGPSVAGRLDALAACSLVEVAEGVPTRFTMLQPVRQFAVARLESDPRSGALRDRHLDWWIQHATGRPVGDQWFSAHWAAELREEFGNFRLAVGRALDTDRADDAARLLGAIHAFSMDGFRSAELAPLADAVLAAWPDPPARFWLATAINSNTRGQHRQLAERLELALGHAIDEGDLACEAWAACWICSALAATDPERSRDLARSALLGARQVGDDELLVTALAWTATALYIVGDTDDALAQLDEAVGYAQPDWSLATSQLYRARAFAALDIPQIGDPEALFEAAVAAAPTGGVHPRLFTLYVAYPRALARDVKAVVQRLDEAFDLCVANDDSNNYADLAIAAAELLEACGRKEEAAAVVAALYRQMFTFAEQYHRYRRLRSRLPAMPTPNRRLTLAELRDVVDANLAVVKDEPTIRT